MAVEIPNATFISADKLGRSVMFVATVPEVHAAVRLDEDGFVLESYEGLDPSRPWMRLTAIERG